ncbi:hypothetical protein AB0B25_31070 [Nocardia sp. NPDC049190]|uniref:hypothetical protein n=1 Tax=Nocardia sp. NPDC049190 TaxID=3155650 RepID=UPI0033E797E3
MTLIQTLVTPSHILQVSDRRLTYPDGRIAEDSHNKAVSWCAQLAFGFTGIAYVDCGQTKSVSEWIAETLLGAVDVEGGIELIRRRAQDVVARLPWLDKRLTIVATGFVDDAKWGCHPVTFVVSNFEYEDTIWPTHQDSFRRTIHFFPNEPHTRYFLRSGAKLSLQHERIVRRRIFPQAKRRVWDEVARRMIILQRFVSTTNVTVGRDSMVISIPKNSTSPGTILTDVTSLGLTMETAGFSFVADGGLLPERYGPHFVCGDSGFLDVKAKQIGPNPGDQRMEVRIIKKADQ